MLAASLKAALLNIEEESLRQDVVRAAVFDMSIRNAAEVLSLALSIEDYIAYNEVLKIHQVGIPASPRATELLLAAGWPIDE